MAGSTEAGFMAALLQGLDASFSSTKPASPFPVVRDTPLIDLTPATPTKLRNVDLDELFAGAENWDLGSDYIPSPKKPSQDVPASEIKQYNPDPYTRCTVDSVSELERNGKWLKQLDVHVDCKPKEKRTIMLQDDWYDTDVRPGDIVNAIGSFSALAVGTPSITISSQANLIILHPDILLTATALSNAPQCSRKPLLASLVRASNDITPALVWGNMLHEVMQDCLLEKRWEEAWINERIDQVLLNGLGMLLILDVSVETARTELRKRAIGLGIFKNRYIADVPKPDAILSDTRSRAKDDEILLAIPQLHEIEEDIWSPKYGLKGKVDATVEAIIAEQPPIVSKNTMMNNYLSRSSSLSNNSEAPNLYTLTSGPRPFEIKTGRSLAGLEHRAQTMLYTLLTSERYGTDVPDGLLYYTQSDTVVRVPRSRNELRGLVVARNELAGYMIKRIGREGEIGHKRQEKGKECDIEEIGMSGEAFLPPPIDSEHACKRCYTLDTCMLYRYAYSATSPASKLPTLESPPSFSDSPSFLYDAYQLKTGHLTPQQGLFFRKWETLLSLEERDLVRFRRELWTIGAEDREKKGRCFGGMVVKPSTHEDEYVKNGKNLAGSSSIGEGKEYKFRYTFARSRDEVDRRSLLNGHMNVGDPVTLSVEPHLLAFAQGYITHLTSDEVRLGVDHRVDLPWIRARMLRDGPGSVAGEEEVIFRIDKDELFGGMGRMRNNLAQLFYANGDRKRLELTVDLRQPVFSPSPTTVESPYTAHLNQSQQQAVAKALSAEDYSLILGMPGTGKTTVIAAFIKTVVAQGKTVFLTSYTHSAVDTILRKLDEEWGCEGKYGGGGLDFGVLRLGNAEKIHADVRKYTLSAKKKAESVEQLEAQWMRPPVVAATCLAVDHPLFNRRQFDYCIVDEASQITLPTCLGPLRFADKFILVGDHFQLPPLVKNPLARRGGLDVSLFRRLSDAHPESVVDLREQYRMNKDIMEVSNKLIYGDRLRCGSEAVAKRMLVLPIAGERDWLEACHEKQRRALSRGAGPRKVMLCMEAGGEKKGGECWLSYLASPSTTAVFVDTDTLGYGVAHDSRVGDLVQNEAEAALVVQFVEALVGRWGVEGKDVGVISLYRQQVKLIQSLFVERGKVGGDVEVLTADKSQGRDKECVVVSMVRSNDEGQVGDLVKDWRRMNVSFTRARSKLVIFGSRKTLKADPLLGQFFELMEGRGWVYELPVSAHLVHKEDLDSEMGEGDGEEEDEKPEELTPSEVGFEDLTLQVDVDEEMDATLVVASPKGSTNTRKILDDDDDDDIEIEDGVYTKPWRAQESSSSRSRREGAFEDDIIIVDSTSSGRAGKQLESSLRSSSSASAPKTRTKHGSKRSKQAGKENSTESVGPLDNYFFAKAGTKRQGGCEEEEKRLKKKAKGQTAQKNKGKFPDGKAKAKAFALLKGRPILQDLVKGEQ